nr:hypothetical protein [Fusobacterium gastrosuis]
MNKKYEKDYYMLVEPQIGELFDPINHREINGNSTGKISELYFYGYGKLNDSEEEKSIDKLIKAALVCAN